MIGVRVAALASLGFALASQSVLAQAPFGYREYALGASVASVVTISGARATETRTLHHRPARIQELESRILYGRSGSEDSDPVHDIRFSFYNDQLYQVVVTYDRDRTEGLTSQDIIESLSATYGLPLLSQRALVVLPASAAADTAVVAQWEDAAALLTLTQGTYRPHYQLVLISKTLDAHARAAIKEALRIDAHEAPQRELDRREKIVSDARVAGQKARIINKAAFRP